MDKNELLRLIQYGREDRNLEFKRSTPWKDTEFKSKIVKSVLAFSNVRDGGLIVIGVEQQDDGTFKQVGMNPEHLKTYKEDQVASYVAKFADPYAKIYLDTLSDNDKIYIIVAIEEFDDIPVVCKNNGAANLKQGIIYTRTHRIPESAAVSSQTEMREILDMAIEKRLKKYVQMQERIGIPIHPSVSDEEKFKAQIRDLL